MKRYRRDLLTQSTTHKSTLSASPLSILSTPSVSASAALILSTMAGLWTEQVLPSIGILMTLCTAALLSNLGLAPASHSLYDLCWTLFLPASLALLLLSTSTSMTEATERTHFVSTVRAVGLAFGIGSLGSVLGCWFAFFICRAFPTLWLSPQHATMAASCLCASYIGGSVNFFSTARVVANNNDMSSSLLGSMAAADLLVMSICFAILTTALQSKRLQHFYACPDNVDDNMNTGTIKGNKLPTIVDGNMNSTSALYDDTSCSQMKRARATISVSLLAYVTVQVANRIDTTLSRFVPGTACAVICGLTSLVKPSKDWQRAATPLSQVCFFLLFSAIGMSANVGYVVKEGPACVWFSLTALFIHMVIVMGGSWLWNLTWKRPILSLNHVLVASNAAIGGPATAAAFCSQLAAVKDKRSWTVASTVWGVVGYAIGTGIGIALFRVLQGMI